MISHARRLLGRLDDRANPILAKEVLQGARSRTFLLLYTLLLLLSLALPVLALNMDDLDDTAGLDLFTLYTALLLVISIVGVPWMAFRSVIRENDGHTLELLLISGMTGRGRIAGYFKAAMLHLLVFFSAVVPFMAMSYLLRGVDILTIIAVTIWLFVIGAMATMWAVWLGTMARPPRNTTVPLLHAVFVVTHGVGLSATLGIAMNNGIAGISEAVNSGLFWVLHIFIFGVAFGIFVALFSAAARDPRNWRTAYVYPPPVWVPLEPVVEVQAVADAESAPPPLPRQPDAALDVLRDMHDDGGATSDASSVPPGRNPE